jgi:hypothetical protein
LLTSGKTSIPERLELEYILVQRRLARGDGQLDEPKLRLRLWKLAHDVARHSRASVAAIFGKPVPVPRSEILAEWVEREVTSTKAYLEDLQSDGRQDADIGESFFRKMLKGQRESRATSAVLGLNTELIEEISRGGGSSHYRWITQRDDLVREWHAELDDRVFAWNSAPSGGGTRSDDSGHPGSGYGCRCLPEPVVGTQPSRKNLAPRPEPATEAAAAGLKKRLRGEIDTGYKGTLKSKMNVEQAESAIKSHKTEHAMIWDKDGNPLMRSTSGEANRITSMRVEDLTRIEIDSPGWKMTHNHPPGASPVLSDDDILLSIAHDAGEMRAVNLTEGGSLLRVVNQDLWVEARLNLKTRGSSGSVHRAVVREATVVNRVANNAAEEALRQFGDIRGRVKEAKEIAHTAFAKAKKAEALKRYNRLGAKYGFVFELF